MTTKAEVIEMLNDEDCILAVPTVIDKGTATEAAAAIFISCGNMAEVLEHLRGIRKEIGAVGVPTMVSINRFGTKDMAYEYVDVLLGERAE